MSALFNVLLGLLRSLLTVQVGIFLLNGFVGQALCLGLMFLLLSLGHVSYASAYVPAFFIGQVPNFFVQKYWVFRAGNGKAPFQMGRFFLKAGFFLCLTLFVNPHVERFLGLNPYVAVVLVGIPLAALDYALSKTIFAEKAKRTPS